MKVVADPRSERTRTREIVRAAIVSVCVATIAGPTLHRGSRGGRSPLKATGGAIDDQRCEDHASRRQLPVRGLAEWPNLAMIATLVCVTLIDGRETADFSNFLSTRPATRRVSLYAGQCQHNGRSPLSRGESVRPDFTCVDSNQRCEILSSSYRSDNAACGLERVSRCLVGCSANAPNGGPSIPAGGDDLE